MQDQLSIQIIIRHLSGAKINKIDQFRLGSVDEISFGRDVSSAVSYDSPKDDIVSRKHAVLRIKNADPPSFALEDLKSSNGTFVNGNRITGEVELLPDDVVEFGSGGPKFSFDVQPRPAGLSARTRVISSIEMNKTRAVGATAQATAKMEPSPTARIEPPATAKLDRPPTQKLGTPVKTGVGQNTVFGLIAAEQKRTNMVWFGALLAVVLVGGVGGGWLFMNNRNSGQQLMQQLQQEVADADQRTERHFAQQTQLAGVSAGEIASKFSASVVVVRSSWRLLDAQTGLPVYHQRERYNGEYRPAYIKMTDNKDDPIQPWLTTYPEQNYEIKGAYRGTGVVVNPQGFILTNRHLAAHWQDGVSAIDYTGMNRGWLFDFSHGNKPTVSDLDLTSNDYNLGKLRDWKPEEDGGFLWVHTQHRIRFTSAPELVNNGRKYFQGKNEYLEVLFPGNPATINANLVRASNDFDAALIKIDSPQTLQAIDMTGDDDVKIGDRVVVLGYPAVSNEAFEVTTGNLGSSRAEYVPSPTVTDGLVALLPRETHHEDNKMIGAQFGEYIQLSVVAAGLGNSGGPVFNSNGKLIGLFTAIREYQGGRMSFAVPIKRARSLLTPQTPL
jgi:serine protease Do